MAHINDCVPGTRAKILRSGVGRVVGKSGVIVEVSRIRRPPTGTLTDRVILEVPGHGEITLSPADIETSEE